MKKRNDYKHKSLIICSECGNKVTIMRRDSDKRKEGHKKHFHCFKCKKRTLHIEGERKDEAY